LLIAVINILIASGIGALVFALSSLIPEMHWGFALLIGILVGFGSMIMLTRRMMKKLEPLFTQAQKQAQARQFKLALQTLQSILPMGKWQVMLTSQIYSQMGVFYYADKNEDLALEHLSKGSVRSPDAQMILASIYFRRGEMDKVIEVMDITIRFNKKQVLIYNAYAFMLQIKNMNDKGMEVLQKGLKAVPGHETTQDNLIRLQNGKKMNMKAFGLNWYSLQLEKPPLSMMQDQFSGRAGFRQAPKRKKG
jgi:tetratricopeptide (TPR) repeat protein